MAGCLQRSIQSILSGRYCLFTAVCCPHLRETSRTGTFDCLKHCPTFDSNNPERSLEHWRKGISTSTFDDPRWADIPVKRNGASGRRMRGCESVAVSEAVKCFNHCTIAREGAKTALLCCSIQLTASIGNSNSSSRLWKSHCLWLRCSRAWGCGSLANACISSSFVCFFPFPLSYFLCVLAMCRRVRLKILQWYVFFRTHDDICMICIYIWALRLVVSTMLFFLPSSLVCHSSC